MSNCSFISRCSQIHHHMPWMSLLVCISKQVYSKNRVSAWNTQLTALCNTRQDLIQLKIVPATKTSTRTQQATVQPAPAHLLQLQVLSHQRWHTLFFWSVIKNILSRSPDTWWRKTIFVFGYSFLGSTNTRTCPDLLSTLLKMPDVCLTFRLFLQVP